MATLLQLVEPHTGTVSDLDALQYFAEEAIDEIVARLPEQYLEAIGTDETDADGVVGSGGVTITGKRLVLAHKSGYRAIEHPGWMQALIDISEDNTYDTRHPIFFRKGGKAYVRPGGGTVVTYSPPSIDIDDDPSATWPSPMWQHAVKAFVISRQLSSDAATIRMAMPTDVTSPTAPTIDAVAPTPDAVAPTPAASAPTIAATPPTLSAAAPTPAAAAPSPAAAAPSTSAAGPGTASPFTLSTAEKTAIDDAITAISTAIAAQPSMGTGGAATDPGYSAPTPPTAYSPVFTNWIVYEGVEDTEMMAAELDRLRVEISDYAQDIQRYAVEVQSASAAYRGAVDIEAASGQLTNAHIIAKYSGDVQAWVAKVTNLVSTAELTLRYYIDKLRAESESAMTSAEIAVREFGVKVQQEGVDATIYGHSVSKDQVNATIYGHSVGKDQVSASIYSTDVQLDSTKVRKYEVDVAFEQVEVGLYQAAIAADNVAVAIYGTTVRQEEVEASIFATEVQQEAVTVEVYSVQARLNQASAEIGVASREKQYDWLRQEAGRWYNMFQDALRRILNESTPRDERPFVMPSI